MLRIQAEKLNLRAKGQLGPLKSTFLLHMDRPIAIEPHPSGKGELDPADLAWRAWRNW